MQWQPIDTAPKDGTNVLLFCTTAVMPKTDIYLLCGGEPFESFEVGWWNDDTSEWETVYCAPPTHWMPLPAKPQ